MEGIVMDNIEITTDDTTQLVTEDLIEEISIDGMCGVY
jgi:mycofactocin precursor